MRNILLEIKYVGTNYFGFQRQNKFQTNEPTIQQEIETALEKLFKQKIKIIGASRTDRGVHARGQIVNFKIDTTLTLPVIKRGLNSFLPSDIAVKRIKHVPIDFHSRYHARIKHYRYLILNQADSDPFLADRAWHVGKPLNLKTMNKAAKLFIGAHDFKLFAKQADKYECGIRYIHRLTITRSDCFACIDIKGSGFMRNMVRNIIQFLVKIGTGTISLPDSEKIFNGKQVYHNIPAPAKGLYLMKVFY